MKKKTRSHSQPKSSKKLLAIVGSIVLLVLLAAVVFGISQLFTSQTVLCRVEGSEQACPPELEQQLSVLKNKPMFFTNYEHILSQAYSASQPYSLVKLTKTLPQTLNLTFKAEQPLVILQQPDSLHVISISGKAFTQTPDSTESLPPVLTVESQTPLITDNAISPDTLRVLTTITNAQHELALPIEKITWLDKSTIRLSMKDRSEVAIIDSESPRLELQRLALILQSKEYQDLAEAKQELDLRFTMPVLRTEP